MNRRMLLLLVVLLSVGTAGAAAADSGERPTVVLNTSGEVQDSQIRLADIAEITADERWEQALAAVVVGSSPLPGNQRRLTVPQIETRLRQAGIHPQDVHIMGSYEVQVRRLQPPAPEHEPMLPASSQDAKDESGGVSSQEILVANRDISQGDIVAREDLRWDVVATRTEYRDVGDISDYVGMQAVRFIRAGTRLTTSAVQTPPAIARGDALWIQAHAGGIVVQAPGTARETGGIGDTIAVVNANSGQRLQAVIINSETVQVPLKGAGAL